MTTFTLTTTQKATVSIEITEEQASAFIDAEVKKLQNKLNEYKAMDFPEAGQAAVNSLRTKVNGIEKAGKLDDEYSYEDLKKRASGASFTGYLADMGIEKSLHGSATRALAMGKAALDGLKLAKVEDKAIWKTVAENAIGGKKAAWHQPVLDWLLHGEADAE